MAKHRAPGDDPIGEVEVTGSPDAYWSVDDSRWPTLRPDLPAEMADLLAPPIVVGVARVPAAFRLTPPGGRPADRARPAPAPRQPAAPAVTGGRHRRTLDRHC
ncbi:hypothetical protein [Micromonospora endolithica]|uniref:Uncharacterized protein n=1 Tax=Micromonospora endolithica TaxID=230091 RepID=A0A3A9Z408_9ACTN|nr:hypothetical protein [Micromonospora endolithica]RKN42136.1 hypothetical protein D7223_23695 [Micromonospora endolithica]TWJ19969.1 hypothetical protein JD76_00055 [Micromonospora endolithica]